MSNIDWDDAIKKEARGINGENLGVVKHVEEGYVLIQRGSLDKENFYIPQDKAADYDGTIVRFSISEEEMKSQYTELGPYSMDTAESLTDDTSMTETQTEETTTVPLTEEKLDVSTQTYEDKVTVTKIPETRTETRDIQLIHEEISIERRQPTITKTTQEPITSKQEIEIPLRREEAVVTKIPHIKEEVVIKKKPVTETETVTEKVTSEDVRTSGNV